MSNPEIPASAPEGLLPDPGTAPLSGTRPSPAPLSGAEAVRQPADYWVDAWERSILFLDLLRRRGNQYFEYTSREGPNVLTFQFELLLDGRTFERPVNFCLVRIVPPEGVKVDPKRRPFIVFDPRAGHGPGIGGMKHDSEIGVALEAGHPCYFVGFLPNPEPGQTVEDVCRAEARFVEKVAELHADSDGKPCLIGNCQAGWQIMMMSAIRPDLVGPIVVVASPLSYWAGVHGKNPLRYLGGVLGGTWLTALSGDIGHGIFDGAHLIANFESMNPSNSLWKKYYQVYANIDSEAERFLEFEKWWGSPVLLNAVEMQSIADELFVGNKLSSGEIFTSEGVRVDLRNIKSPIVVFCSWGDDITPPQQALGWVLDLYDSDEALIAGGQTIIYALHQSIGHLGIFVAAKVATKEHEEFARTMDLIDALPPGLYEAVFVDKNPETVHPELVSGDYVVRFERRSLSDLRALGGNDESDDRRFATVARWSEINQGLYRTFLSPLVRAMTSQQSAEWLRRMHPLRQRYELLSDKNPWMQPIAGLADRVRANRRPVDPANPLLAAQEAFSHWIVGCLDQYRDLRDQATEAFFLSLYDSPVLQAWAGLAADRTAARWRIGRDVAREAAQSAARAALLAQVDRGGIVEAALRALLYIGAAQAQPVIDERVFAALRQLRQQHARYRSIDLARFKEIVREQYLLLHYDQERALATLPRLLPADPAERDAVFGAIEQAVEAAGVPPETVRQRLAQVRALFRDGPNAPAARPQLVHDNSVKNATEAGAPVDVASSGP